jgi:hypothetical protein
VRVGGRILRELPWLSAIDRNEEHVVVRRPGLLVFPFAVRNERNRAAVGREGDRAIFLLRRWRIEVSRGEVAALPVGDGCHEHVVSHVLPPFVPVPVKQPRQPMHLHWIRLGFLRFLPVALLVRALRTDIGDERDPRSVSRPDDRWLRASVQAGHLLHVTAIRIGHVDLHRAIAVRQESDFPAVRRPARVRFSLISFEQGFRLCRAVGGNAEDVGVPLAGLSVGRRAHEEDRSAIRRQGWIRDPRRHNEVFDGHGAARLTGQRGGRDRSSCGDGEEHP